jgi:hypothetical protein
MKYYSVSERKEMLVYNKMLMKLEDVILSEITWSQRGKDHMLVRHK